MKIDPNSTHAKMYSLDLEMAGYSKEFTSTNLCSYMRRVCIYLPLRIFVRTAVILASFGIVLIPALYSPDFLYSAKIAGGVLLVFLAGLVILVIGALSFYLITDELIPNLQDAWQKRESSNPSPFREWITAKKKAICPLIEVGTKEDSQDD